MFNNLRICSERHHDHQFIIIICNICFFSNIVYQQLKHSIITGVKKKKVCCILFKNQD